MTNRRLMPRFLAVLLAAILAPLITGCTTGLGPSAIETERPDFNKQIARSGDEQMLRNLVRLRYNDTPLFLELGDVVASYNFTAAVTGSGVVYPPGGESASVAGGVSWGEHPTITYTPLTGEEFTQRMLTPILLESIMLFNQTGWSTRRLFLLTVQRINNITNAQSATGPLPETPPNYEKFYELTDRLRRLQTAGLLGIDWNRVPADKTGKEAGKETGSERNSCMWIKKPADAAGPLMEDYKAIHEMLEIKEDHSIYELTQFPFDRPPTDIGVRCRSLLGVLYLLSASVEPPAEHEQKGLVTITKRTDGTPFDWHQVTGDLMAIRSQKTRPGNAAVAIEHRGWWFYIADTDLNSKATLNLLNILFSLQCASGKGKSPVLTLPIGRR